MPFWNAHQAKGQNLADIQRRTGIDRSALSKLEKEANEQPTIETVLRYAEVVAKRITIEVRGRWTPGCPEGEFPLAIAFSLADGSDTADKVPPQGSKGWLPSYLAPAK